MAEFDRFSTDYARVLDDSVQLSGEGSAWFAAHKARHVAGLVPPGFAGRILDFGCGVGLLSSALAEALPAARLDGFDVSAASLAAVPAALRARGVFTADAAALGDDYDLVVVSNVLHHVPPADRPAVAADLAARLAPGGRVVVFEHNPWNPVTRRVVDRCPFDRDAVLLRPAEAAAHLQGAGLAPVSRTFVLFFPRALSVLRPLERALGWCPLGAQYVVVAAKGAR